MDISLLYILLRNIAGIHPHCKGWGNDPDPRDLSLSASIERIRLIRNRCVHSVPFMSHTDFNSIWSTIKSAMVVLDVFLNNGNKYEKEIDFLRHESMDPDRDLQYREELRKQVEQDNSTREMVDNLKNKVEKLTMTPIPSNVREQYDIDIQKWREEDKLYFETHSFPTVMQKVRNQPYVTFVGVPGSGKSATAHHIALKLHEEGYEVVPIKDVGKREDYGDPRNPQVFVIDDVVGVFGLQKSKLHVLTDYEQKITSPCMAMSKTLMTCREAVFNETLPYKSFLTNEETVIKLYSSDHALDDNDKMQILKKYGLDVDLILPALLTSTSRMFPLLCKLFSKEAKFQVLGSKFFMNPFQCVIRELDDMQRHNKVNYATLILCMMNENRLSEHILAKNTEKNVIIQEVLKNCRLKKNIDTLKFVNALSAMEGTYTKQCGAHYTFIHDSMFEICAKHYGKQFPDQMLLYMSSSYIANYVKPQTSEPRIVNKTRERQSDSQCSDDSESSNDSDGKEVSGDQNNGGEKSFDLCIRLREDQYPLLAKRLYRDIQNMELYDVFMNQVLKHPQVRRAFIGLLKTKSYKELKSLFLSSQENVDKIVSKQELMLEESKETEWRDERLKQKLLLDQRYKRDDEGERLWDEFTCNVRVISWLIYYGHHEVLRYIVKQTERHKEISELFRIAENTPNHFKSGIFKRFKSRINYIGQKKTEMSKEQFRLLLLSCYSGDVETVKTVLFHVCMKSINGIGNVSRNEYGEMYNVSPLHVACKGGYAIVVQELLKAGADVNLRDTNGNGPLVTAVRNGPLSIVKCLMEHGADWATQVVNVRESAVYRSLILNKLDIVKYLVQEQNKLIPCDGNAHLLNCLADIRHAEVKTDSRDDVVLTNRAARCVDREGYLWRTISEGDCDALSHLLSMGLGVNQWIQLYDTYHTNKKSAVRHLLYTLIDERSDIKYRAEKVKILLEAGVDVYVRVRYRKHDSFLDRMKCRKHDYLLDREGVSALERTRRLVYEHSKNWRKHRLPEYNMVMCEIKKHIRRHSV